MLTCVLHRSQPRAMADVDPNHEVGQAEARKGSPKERV